MAKNCIDFINELQLRLSGKVSSDKPVGLNILEPAFPKLFTQYKGYSIQVDFRNEQELEISVLKEPPHQMVIIPKGFFKSLLTILKLNADERTGNPRFDRHFLVQDIPQELVKKTLEPNVIDLINRLMPFYYFHFHRWKYYVRKDVTIYHEYRIDNCIMDIELLIELVKVVEKIYAVLNDKKL
jgi:hypothetical protein